MGLASSFNRCHTAEHTMQPWTVSFPSMLEVAMNPITPTAADRILPIVVFLLIYWPQSKDSELTARIEVEKKWREIKKQNKCFACLLVTDTLGPSYALPTECFSTAKVVQCNSPQAHIGSQGVSDTMQLQQAHINQVCKTLKACLHSRVFDHYLMATCEHTLNCPQPKIVSRSCLDPNSMCMGAP